MTPSELLDRALLSPRGIECRCGSEKEAMALRFRLYRALNKDRKRNEAEGNGDGSDWDSLKIVVESNIVQILPHPDPEVIEL